MKSEKQVNNARVRLCERLKEPGLSDVQKSLVGGMLNALCWVAESHHGSTVDRMLSDRHSRVLIR